MSTSTFKGSDVARTRSRVATATRTGTEQDVAEARREFAEAKLADYIAKTVDSAPPLTDAQRDRLATLLRGGNDG